MNSGLLFSQLLLLTKHLPSQDFLLEPVWDITWKVGRAGRHLSNYYKLSDLIIYILNVLRPVLEAAAEHSRKLCEVSLLMICSVDPLLLCSVCRVQIKAIDHDITGHSCKIRPGPDRILICPEGRSPAPMPCCFPRMYTLLCLAWTEPLTTSG